MAKPKAEIVLVGGTVRPTSSTQRALEYLRDRFERSGCTASLFGGEFLAGLPHYDPSQSSGRDAGSRFIDAVRRCAGIVVASPGYHGSVSGPVKNALDWVEDLVDDERPYLSGRVFGTVVVANGPQSLGTSLTALRSIAHALRAWPTPLGVAINTTEHRPGDSGWNRQLDMLARQVAEFVDWQRSAVAA